MASFPIGLRMFRRAMARLRDVAICTKCKRSVLVFSVGDSMRLVPEVVTPETHCTCRAEIVE